MLKSHLTTGLRQLTSQRLYATISMIGLAVGLAAAILVGLFVRHELSYDRYHAKAERIFRVSRVFSPPGAEPFRDATMPPIVAPLLKSEFSDIAEVARLLRFGTDVVVSRGDRSYIAPRLAAADNDLFKIFDFDWLSGDSATALRDLNSIVITEGVAEKYFGAEPALGKTLVIETPTPVTVTVTGVIRDLPENTHLSFDMLLSIRFLESLLGADALDRWNSGGYHTYVLLRPGANIGHIQEQSKEFFERHMPNGLGKLNDFKVQSLADIHFSLPLLNEMKPPGSLDVVYASSIVTALILLIACINFVNLATASARRRAKEVGVRKTLGAARRRLIVQFLGESLLLTTIATAFALAAVRLLLPAASAFLQKDLELHYGDAPTLAVLIGVPLLVGLAAGSFPAFYLSAFEPARVLKGEVTRGRTASLLRNLLVGGQFAIAIALLIATFVVYRQITYIRNFDPGYDKEQIVVVDDQRTGLLSQRWDVLKREWLADPEITAATATSHVPGLPATGMYDLLRGEGGSLKTSAVNMRFVAVDPDFFATYRIKLLAGRLFSRDAGPDLNDVNLVGSESLATTVAIINARAARAFGWTPEEAVGKEFWSVPLGAPDRGPQAGAPARRIIGVIDDINFQPLREPIVPMMFILPRGLLRAASLKITGRNVQATLAHIDDVWSRIVPERPISKRFLDDDFAAVYQSETRQGQMLSYCSLLAIFIACLGLFGLASLTTEQRTKEIGIRKVLGGTVLDIVRLFAGEMGWLVLVANVVAWPVAYLLMRHWLDRFAYRVELNFLAFAGSGFLVLAVAWLTVGAVAARAARAKPIHSLRYE